MKAYELSVKLDSDGKVELPANLTQMLKEASEARIILLVESADDEGWAQLSRKQFAAGYSDTDSIYDTL